MFPGDLIEAVAMVLEMEYIGTASTKMNKPPFWGATESRIDLSKSQFIFPAFILRFFLPDKVGSAWALVICSLSQGLCQHYHYESFEHLCRLHEKARVEPMHAVTAYADLGRPGLTGMAELVFSLLHFFFLYILLLFTRSLAPSHFISRSFILALFHCVMECQHITRTVVNRQASIGKTLACNSTTLWYVVYCVVPYDLSIRIEDWNNIASEGTFCLSQHTAMVSSQRVEYRLLERPLSGAFSFRKSIWF